MLVGQSSRNIAIPSTTNNSEKHLNFWAAKPNLQVPHHHKEHTSSIGFHWQGAQSHRYLYSRARHNKTCNSRLRKLAIKTKNQKNTGSTAHIYPVYTPFRTDIHGILIYEIRMRTKCTRQTNDIEYDLFKITTAYNPKSKSVLLLDSSNDKWWSYFTGRPTEVGGPQWCREVRESYDFMAMHHCRDKQAMPLHSQSVFGLPGWLMLGVIWPNDWGHL